MKNIVKVFEDNKLIAKGHNLVVYTGRTFLMNKLTGSTSTQGWYLNLFAVGNGGGDPTNPLAPLAPQPSDTNLNSPLILGSAYAFGGYYKGISSITQVTPTSCMVTLDVSQSDLSTYGTVIYNEIGLFISNPNLGLTPILYAKITMPVQKTIMRAQQIQWYLFF